MKSHRNYALLYVVVCLFLLLTTGCTGITSEKLRSGDIKNKELKYKFNINIYNLIKVKAEPKKGFNYDYYLYIPGLANKSEIKYMLVEPNNSGTASDDSSFHDEKAAELVKNGICRTIANELNIPLLVPTFDRPISDWKMYTHALDRDTLLNKEGKLARIDLQLIEMIENAQQILKENGIDIEDKVFLNGFSASGNFVNRFTALYPDKVKAVASGGINGMPILPLETMNGEKLIYHVGIADVGEITGIKFNLKEYKKVPQYMYMGYLDTNDTLKYSDAYSREEVIITEKVLGREMQDRWKKSQEILKEVGIPAQMVTYNGAGHEIKKEMVNDIIAFFKANAGKKINFIEPSEYPFTKGLKKLEQVHVKAAYWYGDPEIPGWIQYLKQNSFIILIDEWIHSRNYDQLSEFENSQPGESREFLLKKDGRTITEASIRYNFSKGDGSFQGYILEIPENDISLIEKGVLYSLELKDKENKHWIINEDVTITRLK